jgi:hypothetical protein
MSNQIQNPNIKTPFSKFGFRHLTRVELDSPSVHHFVRALTFGIALIPLSLIRQNPDQSNGGPRIIRCGRIADRDHFFHFILSDKTIHLVIQGLQLLYRLKDF